MNFSLFAFSLTIIVVLMNPSVPSRVQAQASRNQDLNPADLTQAATRSVVLLTGKTANGQSISAGSGFFIRDGLIATDYRLIKDALEIHAKLSGQEATSVTLVGVDARWAVAVVKVTGIKASPLVRGYSKHVQAGDEVYVVNNPDGFNGTLSKAAIKEVLTQDGKRYFKLSSPSVLNTIGGPLLNSLGQVVGVVASAPTGQSDSSFAIPASYLTEFGYNAIGSGYGQEGPPDIPDDMAGEARANVSGGPPVGLIAGAGEKEGSKSDTGRVIRKAGGILQGTAIRRAEPLYPPLAKAARVTGAIVVEVVVNEEGDVISARSISGHPLLKDAAVAAARGWKFTATTLDGKAVKVIGAITFNFAL